MNSIVRSDGARRAMLRLLVGLVTIFNTYDLGIVLRSIEVPRARSCCEKEGRERNDELNCLFRLNSITRTLGSSIPLLKGFGCVHFEILRENDPLPCHQACMSEGLQLREAKPTDAIRKK